MKRRQPEKRKSSRRASPDEALLRRARAQFKVIQETEAKQRERELEDIRFYAGDQWPQEILDGRQGQPAQGNLPAVPSRPCITINKAREPVRQVLNQERQSDLAVTIVPADDFGEINEPVSDTEIELREGLVRRIQRTSDAAHARTWAFERATIAGRGYYGVMIRFGDGKTRDKEIFVRRFYNQAAVSLGPHEEPDGSDADHGFVGTLLTLDEYAAEFPKAIDGSKNGLIQAAEDDDYFKALGEEYPDWFTTEYKNEKDKGDKKKGTRMCRVVEYWYTEVSSRELVFLSDGRDVWRGDMEDADKALETDPETGELIGSRMVVEKQIKFAKIDGTQVLEKTDWPGHYIPIVKVLGEELQPYDDQRRCEGMVRPGIQAWRGFNIMVSKLVEQVGLTPIPPIIVDPESIEPYLDWWKLGATRALFMLPQLTRDDQGREFREAHRPAVDPNLQPLAMSIGMFDQFGQSVVGVHDPSTGKVDPRLKSGSAIKAVVQQDAQGTSNFLDNLQRSVHYEGRIENDLLYPVYGTRPGRIAKMVTGEGEAQTVMMNQPFISQDGQPKPVMVPHPTDPMRQVPAPMGHPMVPATAQTYTLTKDATFNVAIKVTKNMDLRRDQLASVLGELVSANPQAMAEYGDIFWKAMDTPDHEELSERAALLLAPPIQAAKAAKASGANIPPELAQKMAGDQQQIKHAEAAIQQLHGEIQTKQVERASHEKIAQWELASKERIAAADRLAASDDKAKDRAAKIEAARITASKQAADPAAEAREEAQALDVEQLHEVRMAGVNAVNDSNLSAQEHAQDMEAAAQPLPVDPNTPPPTAAPQAGAQ